MKYKLFSMALFLVIFIGLSSSVSFAEGDKIIADFNSGETQNNLGGKIEVWLAGDGSDPTQFSKMLFVSDDALGNVSGKSLRIDYDVDSENPAYNGVRTDLNQFDATNYKTLNFYMKGDAAAGFTKTLKIELIGKNGQPSPYMVNGITENWQKITIPLSEFLLIKDWSTLQKFVVVFADINNNPKVGTVYLDQVYFSKN